MVATVLLSDALIALGLGTARPGTVAAKTPPLASAIGSTWTWTNQGTATGTQNTAGQFVLAGSAAGSDDWKILTKTLPARPTTLTIEVDFNAMNKNFCSFGVVYRDSSTGKFMFYGLSSNSASITIAGGNYTNATTFSAANNLSISSAQDFYQPRFFRITDDGTNLLAYVSQNGIDWIQTNNGTVTRTSFCAAPDQIGFAMNCSNTGGLAQKLVISDLYSS